ncbi:flavodoxin-dependent (E)-4-hydroxy-3-methylbut-2-enyl-diphosphate synthase [Lyticum sinuosum]|uniref:4-hydroxy-3-methylbut-2-en-1-yl diphosphate synthase (flavodoxin) n=1 Tax=Lyticum sinuosum TaxID=1332059 RepID=A0AAE5AGN8_9RICK|nr:flavodoxin-dependent (E)-4-hydroxy-3-methylbut-2-enyl-diphosphate synthase [Lyticum sinuosum]MDZ5760997.1 4-hydroxy-3-methylbut-2-en-1-yl diphosphate synthase [Lyticum sinuosum]
MPTNKYADVGGVIIGRGYPIVVQSMTSSPTQNIEQTVNEIIELADAGSEIVRITVNNIKAAIAVPIIKDKLISRGYKIPLVGCFHYNGHQLLKQISDCAKSLDKYRINPGNVGFGNNRDKNLEQIIEIASYYKKPIRIGVNWGSLDKTVLDSLMKKNAETGYKKSDQEVLREAIITSALSNASYAEKIGLPSHMIIISAKVSRVPDLISIYRELYFRSNYALHVGLTEAGLGNKGIVSTTAALSILLKDGIGNTIRASLTQSPGEPRSNEVQLCLDILQSLGLRNSRPSITACPGCGRTNSDYFRKLAQTVEDMITEKMSIWRQKYPKVVDLRIAVMGCIVNGPGESKHADIGISLPGDGEYPLAPVFINGKKCYTLRGDNIAGEFCKILDNYVENNFSNIIN